MSLMTALSRWAGLTHFIDDGRIELDNNTVERSIRLFSGSDGGAEHWATIASLIETCKLSDLDPLAYLTDASPGSPTVIPTATSISYFRGPTAVKTSKPWPENDAYSMPATHTKRPPDRPTVLSLTVGVDALDFALAV
jgi:hypothetical protein